MSALAYVVWFGLVSKNESEIKWKKEMDERKKKLSKKLDNENNKNKKTKNKNKQKNRKTKTWKNETK